MTDKKDIRVRAMLVYLALMLVCVLVFGKVIAIQSSGGSGVAQEDQHAATRTMTIAPIRGTIYSADGQILATSDPRYEIRMDVKVVPDELFETQADSLALELSFLFKDRTKRQYYQMLTTARREGRRYQLIKTNVSGREYKLLQQFPIFKAGKYKGGMIAIKTEKRKKPYGILASRTIGYVREDVQPVGLEGAFNEELSGVEGKQLMRREGARWIPVSDKFEQEPRNGLDMYTTIDVRLQDVAENELLRQLKEQGAQHGCVILMETKTGYIRAMANLSKTENGNYEEVYNHALGRSTEPGSTFKLASMMVGIEQGYINLNDTVGTNDGTYRFHDRIMRDSKEGGYGKISAQDGFAFSSNVAISRLVHKAFASQPEKFVEGISKLGIAQKTGISIIGEVDPFIRKPSETGWSGISLPWMSIGYETRFTPLQILNLYNAVANNGVMVRPQLVQEFRRGKDVVKKFEPEIINPQIASPRTIAAARKMLEAVVDYGTGKKLQAANFRIAGKTGTTQIAQDGGGYGKGSGVRHQASFVGYFPAEDPIFTAIVVIAAPTKNIYGAEVSGTVFKAIADKVYSGSLQYHAAINDQPNSTKVHLPTTKNGYQTEIKTVLSHLNIPMQSNTRDSDWVVTESTNKLVNLRAKNVSTNMVPDVRGMSLKDALYLIENMGMLAKATGAGKITAQSIAPGTAIRGEMIIELTLK